VQNQNLSVSHKLENIAGLAFRRTSVDFNLEFRLKAGLWHNLCLYLNPGGMCSVYVGK
jgi:hypothetical protein